ncbi:uncharacterized protein LOC121868061 isoform X2 [Homarus americanus]
MAKGSCYCVFDILTPPLVLLVAGLCLYAPTSVLADGPDTTSILSWVNEVSPGTNSKKASTNTAPLNPDTTHDPQNTATTQDPQNIATIQDRQNTTTTPNPQNTATTPDSQDREQTGNVNSENPLKVSIENWAPVGRSDFLRTHEATKSQENPKVLSDDEKEEELVVVQETRVGSSVAEMSTILVQQATICSSYIDDFKDDFVLSTLGKTWKDAQKDYPPGSIPEPYLPDLPNPGVYTPKEFSYELVRTYGLMQHYIVALEHLFLDQNLYLLETTMLQQVDQVDRDLVVLLQYMKDFAANRGLTPDNDNTKKLMVMTYTRVDDSSRRLRDFGILRDTQAGLQHISEVFNSYL